MAFTWTKNEDYVIGSTGHDISKFQGKKIAAFDLDDTLLKYFKQNQGKYELYDKVIIEKINKLVSDGFLIVIVTNQSSLTKKFDKWSGKVMKMIEILGVDITVFVACSDNMYRKPRIGIWEEFIDGDVRSSFYCGDAGGLDGDFSDTDLKFAWNIGIKFIHRNEFLYDRVLNCVPKYFTLLTSNENTEFVPDSPEIIINVGFPGSGKSTYASENILKHGYIHINQDQIKTNKKCTDMMIKTINEGKSCVIDNTNLSVASRGVFLEIAKKNNIKCRCLLFDTPLEVCQHNNYYRNYVSKGAIKVVPKMVYNMMKKSYQEPTLNEGFHKIQRIQYSMNPDSRASYKYYYI